MCGASRYKNNDLYDGEEASTGKKRKKGGKNVVQDTQPLDDTPLCNDAKQRRISALVVVPASGRSLDSPATAYMTQRPFRL